MVNNPFVIQQPQQQVDTSFLSGLGQILKTKQDSNPEVNTGVDQPQLSGIGQHPQQTQPQNMEQPNQEQQQSSQIIDSPIGSIAAAAIIKSINSRVGV